MTHNQLLQNYRNILESRKIQIKLKILISNNQINYQGNLLFLGLAFILSF